MAEQLTLNQRVEGSSPSGLTTPFHARDDPQEPGGVARSNRSPFLPGSLTEPQAPCDNVKSRPWLPSPRGEPGHFHRHRFGRPQTRPHVDVTRMQCGSAALQAIRDGRAPYRLGRRLPSPSNRETDLLRPRPTSNALPGRGLTDTGGSSSSPTSGPRPP